MSSENIRNTKQGLKHGLINNVINMILPFITRTIILYTLGTSYLGLGSLFTSVLSLLSLSELGLGSAIAYMLYEPVALGDTKKVNQLLNFYKKCYRYIGLAILSVGLIIVPILRSIIHGDVPVGINIYILYGMYLSQTVISYFLFSYKTVLLTANQRYDVFVKIMSITKILTSVLQVILLLLFKNYYLYVFVLPLMAFVENLLDNYFVTKMFPNYKPEGKISKEESQELLKNVIGAFSMKIGETIYLSADQIVISACLGLAILGIYGNYYYIISAIVAVFAVLHNTLRPIVGKYIVVNSVEENFTLFKTMNYGYELIAIWCTSCLITLYQPFMKIWVGQNNMLSYVMVILLAIYFFSGRLCGMLGIYNDAAGIWWHGKYIALGAGLGNLALNIVLVQIIGLPGILISSIASSLLISFPGYTYVVFKYYFKEKDYLKAFLTDMAKLSLCCIVTSAIVSKLLSLFQLEGIIGFIVLAFLCAILSIAVILCLNFKSAQFQKLVAFTKQHI